MPRKQKELSPAQLGFIDRQYQAGRSIKDIAKELHVDKSKVSNALKAIGHEVREAGRPSVVDIINQQRIGEMVVNIPPHISTKEPVGDSLVPPVGNVWKPWMIPTEMYIPPDIGSMDWKEYAKDYDRRKQICDERNAKLKKRLHGK